MANFAFPWVRQAQRYGVVADTGVLLLHAFSSYEQGRYLRRVAADIPSGDIDLLVSYLGDLFATVKVCTTPQVMTEFQALSQARARLGTQRLASFLCRYSEFPLTEHHIELSTIAERKTALDAWTYSYTDTSVVLAGLERKSPVLTLDRAMRGLGGRLNVPVIHAYEDFFLHL